MLSRTKPAAGSAANAMPASKQKDKKKKIPKLEELLDNRDYTGAITLLEVANIIINIFFKCSSTLYNSTACMNATINRLTIRFN